MGKVAEPKDVEAADESVCPYTLLPSRLNAMNSEKDMKALAEAGGIEGLAKSLQVDLHKGLSSEEGDGAGLHTVRAHREAYGENKLPERESASLLEMMLDAAKDPMIIILLVVALVTIVLGAAVPEQRAHNGWSEGVAVFGTALIVVMIAAGQDYNKERQFQKLNALKDIIEVKVKRDGKQIVIQNTDVVVGDVLFLDTGDKVIADALVISSQGLVLDEASLTGESDPIKKDAEHDPWVRSGTAVNEGSGYVLVTAVGTNSEWGKTMALVNEAGDEETPLQEQLTYVATQISKLGVLAAVICFLALFIKWLVVNKGFPVSKINENGPLQFLLYAITITVVSIPEGLPLAVTLTLAYSMKKMMNDNNFVRVLAACETMGGATAICSDKTGTLTENRMTVVEGWFAGKHYTSVPDPEEMPRGMLELLAGNSAMNSKAFLVDQPTGVVDFVGNRTECALLMLLRKFNIDYQKVRDELTPAQVRLFGFSSARKMASVLLRQPEQGKLRLYNKGAAEWVLKRCASLLNEDGTTSPVDEARLAQMLDIVTSMAKRGLRCICLTYRDYEEKAHAPEFFEDADQLDNGLIAYAIVGIKDPVRKEVPAAVATCQRAGIVVRMVTGDNIHTAQHISRECGILVEGEDTIALEGPVFRSMSAQELVPLLPRLRVLARSSPEDKLTLVSLLKKQGEVVAVTGDGTNDAPALKESDVGLAMGIAGTEVAKEAADIIILDDNFNSIVKAVLWGRAVFANIRKFLVFQLSINLVAMLSACIGALYGGVPPLNVLQLLWVNMIMDTLAALALATEEPYDELLDDPPHGRTEPLITLPMYVNIIAAAAYKLFWLLICLYGLPHMIPRYALLSETTFYQTDCKPYLSTQGWNATSVNNLCNWMGYCGWPVGGETRDTSLCNLYQGVPVPSDPRAALCGTNTTGSCPNYNMLLVGQSQMDDEYDKEYRDSYKPALSVLFNFFILAQVANAFVSRRYNYELDFFRGILNSPIFLTIMFFITVMQVIIMQTPISYVFKVQPLDGWEWLASFGVGFACILYSWAVRITIRWLQHVSGGRSWISILRGERLAQGVAGARTTSGRTTSGRTASGRTASGDRTGSGQPGSGQPAGSPRGSGKVVPAGPADKKASWA